VKAIASRLGIVLILATLHPAAAFAEEKMVVDMRSLPAASSPSSASRISPG
jgi:hypothetical protein